MPDCAEPDDEAATAAAVGTVGDFRFFAPPALPAVFDTGTVIVDAEVTATVVDATVVLVCDEDDDDDLVVVPPEEEDEDAASTYSVEVIVAAFVVVGGRLVAESDAAAVGLRADAVEEAVAVAAVAAGVDSEPFAWSNDSSVFVDLSAVVLADVLVVHFITDEWQVDVDTLLELLLLLLLVAVAATAVAVSLPLLLLLLLVVPVVSPAAAAEDEGGWSRGPAAALTSLLVAAAEAVAFF